MSSTISRTATGLLTAVGIFIIAVVLPKFVVSGIVPKLITTQSLELALSLLAIALLGRGCFGDYGFRLPKSEYFSTSGLAQLLMPVLGALGVGMAASIAILILGGSGNPMVKQLSLPQIILFVWIFSSIIEEVFTRGFLQSHLSIGASTERLPVFRVSRPTLIAAAFFAAMHLVLFISGIDAVSIIVTLLFTFSLGLLAGHQRERSGSLLPAIGIHMLGNIGGFLGGICYVIVLFLTGGKPPGM